MERILLTLVGGHADGRAGGEGQAAQHQRPEQFKIQLTQLDAAARLRAIRWRIALMGAPGFSNGNSGRV